MLRLLWVRAFFGSRGLRSRRQAGKRSLGEVRQTRRMAPMPELPPLLRRAGPYISHLLSGSLFLGTRLHFIQNASPTYVQSFVTIIQHQCLCKQNIFTKMTTLCKLSLYRPPYLVAITEHNLCDPPWYQATFKNGQSIKIVTWYQKTSLIALAIILAAPLAKNQILQNKSGFHIFAWFAHWHTAGKVCTSTLFCWNLMESHAFSQQTSNLLHNIQSMFHW